MGLMATTGTQTEAVTIKARLLDRLSVASQPTLLDERVIQLPMNIRSQATPNDWVVSMVDCGDSLTVDLQNTTLFDAGLTPYQVSFDCVLPLNGGSNAL